MSITQKATIFKLLASLTTGVHQHVLVLLPGRLTGASSLSTTDSCCFYDLGLEDGPFRVRDFQKWELNSFLTKSSALTLQKEPQGLPSISG